jgi:hypothetical protein
MFGFLFADNTRAETISHVSSCLKWNEADTPGASKRTIAFKPFPGYV